MFIMNKVNNNKIEHATDDEPGSWTILTVSLNIIKAF